MLKNLKSNTHNNAAAIYAPDQEEFNCMPWMTSFFFCFCSIKAIGHYCLPLSGQVFPFQLLSHMPVFSRFALTIYLDAYFTNLLGTPQSNEVDHQD
jgi:hypothetical protein